MSIDAGTIYSAIRLKLDNLDSDIRSATAKMQAFGAKLEEVGKKTEGMKKIGTNLTLGLTAPIVAASAAMVKFASDQNESLNAANVVFGKSAKIITDWGDKAAKQAGLAKSEFYQSAAVIGAGFKNAGYELDEAANQTVILTQRAADMASIFNTDVNDAMTAMQSALRGEYEPARRFAVSLSEDAVAAKAVEMGIAKTGTALTNYQKTQARMALIMQQTAQFQGDFVNTSDQLANSTRILQAELKNEAAELGAKLLPALLDIVKGARTLVENFSKLDDGTRNTILVIAGLAAATGPMIIGIAKTVDAVNTLKIAMAALNGAAGPIALVIAGVGAMTLALKAAGDANQKEMLADVAQEFKNVGELAGVSAEKISSVEEMLARMSRGEGTATELKDTIAQIAADTGLTEEQVLAIGNHSVKTTTEFRNQLNLAESLLQTQRASEKAVAEGKKYIIGSAEWIEAQRKSQEKISAEKGKQNKLSEKEVEREKARAKAEEDYLGKRELLDLKRRDSLISETEYTKGIADAQAGYLDVLYQLGYAYDTQIGSKGHAAYASLLESLKEYNKEQATQTQNYEYFKEVLGSINDLDAEYRHNALIALEDQINGTDLEIEKKQELINTLHGIADATELAMKKNLDFTGAAKTGMTTLLSGFGDIGEAIATNSLGIEDFGKLMLKAVAATLEAIGAELAAYALEAQVLSFLKLFAPEIAFPLALAGSATAYTLAGAVRGFAGSFEDGGIVPGNSYTGDKLIARVNSGEEVITRDDPRHAMNGGGQMTLVLELDGEVLAQTSAEYYNNGYVRLKLK